MNEVRQVLLFSLRTLGSPILNLRHHLAPFLSLILLEILCGNMSPQNLTWTEEWISDQRRQQENTKSISPAQPSAECSQTGMTSPSQNTPLYGPAIDRQYHVGLQRRKRATCGKKRRGKSTCTGCVERGVCIEFQSAASNYNTCSSHARLGPELTAQTISTPNQSVLSSHPISSEPTLPILNRATPVSLEKSMKRRLLV